MGVSPLRHTKIQTNSSVSRNFTYQEATIKLLRSKLRLLSTSQHFRLHLKWHIPPYSSFDGPNQVIYYCCYCNAGPWRVEWFPHCQVCQHQQCNACRFTTI